MGQFIALAMTKCVLIVLTYKRIIQKCYLRISKLFSKNKKIKHTVVYIENKKITIIRKYNNDSGSLDYFI